MTRINLVKYGFVRCPEEDFSDDGNRFQAYKVGRVLVTKLVSDGEAYISGGIPSGKLPYEVYSKLPHYPFLGALNGISTAHITEDDLQELYEACQAYDLEYANAENTIEYPTIEEITEKCHKITDKRLLEFDTIVKLLNKHAVDAAMKFSAIEWRAVQEYLHHIIADANRFNPDTYPQTIYRNSSSFNFVLPNTYMEDSYWFTYLRDLFKRYCMC